MRTTVSINDELLAAARHRARAKGVTLGAVVDAALRRELSTDPDDNGPGPVLPVFLGGSGPRPGLDLTSNRTIHEALDADLDLDRLR